ncbi:DNA polymerase Y family protein [Bauldia litoralis]|uniref:Y-family DNA polymerase n=1 Tax=Bauldia litoralis TaxID=665467 RepID=UPI00326629D5
MLGHSPSLEGRTATQNVRETPPLVVVAKARSALRLVALDETARRRGLHRGQALADARAIIPAIDAVDADPASDAALLAAIADWAERYTPLVALDGNDGLMLDITGCAHLFGGEAALVADLAARLPAQGFAARAAIADTPGAAWAAARYAETSRVAPGGARDLLVPLPFTALRLDDDIVAALDRVGLKRIGQILDAPRAPLAARFGASLMRRLDQALGREEEAIDPRRPVAALIAERRFAESIGLEDDIAATIASLAATLARNLEQRGEGARRFELSLFRVDGVVTRLGVGTSRPVRAPKHVLGLFAEKFASLADELDAGFGFDMARLSVPVTAPDTPAQVDLAGDAVGEADLGQLIDRIGARIGPERVRRIVPRDSHIPERSEAWTDIDAAAHALSPGRHWGGLPPPSAHSRASGNPGSGHHYPSESGSPPARGRADGRSATNSDGEVSCVRALDPPLFPAFMDADPIDRPLRLFARPEPVEATAAVPDGPPMHFRWRRALYRIARSEGPERIAPEWWCNDEDETRDYFRVEDATGHRFWLFREGLYGRETIAPRWYLHGVFG